MGWGREAEALLCGGQGPSEAADQSQDEGLRSMAPIQLAMAGQVTLPKVSQLWLFHSGTCHRPPKIQCLEKRGRVGDKVVPSGSYLETSV